MQYLETCACEIPGQCRSHKIISHHMCAAQITKHRLRVTSICATVQPQLRSAVRMVTNAFEPGKEVPAPGSCPAD